MGTDFFSSRSLLYLDIKCNCNFNNFTGSSIYKGVGIYKNILLKLNSFIKLK
jgi:hypothetical protein